jgi:hypothetical protein
MYDEKYGQFDVFDGHSTKTRVVIVVEPLNDYAIDKAGIQTFKFALYRQLNVKRFQELAKEAFKMYIEQYMKE